MTYDYIAWRSSFKEEFHRTEPVSLDASQQRDGGTVAVAFVGPEAAAGFRQAGVSALVSIAEANAHCQLQPCCLKPCEHCGQLDASRAQACANMMSLISGSPKDGAMSMSHAHAEFCRCVPADQ